MAEPFIPHIPGRVSQSSWHTRRNHRNYLTLNPAQDDRVLLKKGVCVFTCVLLTYFWSDLPTGLHSLTNQIPTPFSPMSLTIHLLFVEDEAPWQSINGGYHQTVNWGGGNSGTIEACWLSLISHTQGWDVTTHTQTHQPSGKLSHRCSHLSSPLPSSHFLSFWPFRTPPSCPLFLFICSSSHYLFPLSLYMALFVSIPFFPPFSSKPSTNS